MAFGGDNMTFGGDLNDGNMDSLDDELTLDEPIPVTLMRDLKGIAHKVRHVLVPISTQESAQELRNWDLWGPLLFCLTLSISLSWNVASDASDVFALVFSLFWVGSCVVTLNAKLLQGKVSFFQSLCVLGYCLFPLVLSSLLCTLILNASISTAGQSGNVLKTFVEVSRFAVVIGSWAWANKAATVFIAQLVGDKRRILAVYPVVLLYSAIAWMILT